MKRVFWFIPLLMALGLAAGLSACGGDSGPTSTGGAGGVSGTVTFIGGWPAGGNVQVSIYSNLAAPGFVPTGPPDAFTNPIASGLTQYAYTLPGLDEGTYAGVLVSWRDPANPSGAKLLGMYWIYPDSVAINTSGPDAGTAKSPGPTPIIINSAQLKHTGLNITADLDIVP